MSKNFELLKCDGDFIDGKIDDVRFCIAYGHLIAVIHNNTVIVNENYPNYPDTINRIMAKFVRMRYVNCTCIEDVLVLIGLKKVKTGDLNDYVKAVNEAMEN